jgi:hypothetical protein
MGIIPQNHYYCTVVSNHNQQRTHHRHERGGHQYEREAHREGERAEKHNEALPPREGVQRVHKVDAQQRVVELHVVAEVRQPPAVGVRVAVD